MIEAPVQIVGPTDNWVLERLARRLADLLPCAEFVAWKPRPGRGTRLAYYVNYALYAGPSGLIDVGFFTHEDERFGFLERARQMDFCVCMARLYAERLRAQGVSWVEHIPMGFDAERYRPRLVLGVVGRLDTPRKGRHLVEELRRLPFVEVVATEGKLGEEEKERKREGEKERKREGEKERKREGEKERKRDELRDFYQRLDYVLIPATVEGGPMSLLEGLGMGKPVIAPEGVGMVGEFPECPQIRKYTAGDIESLVRVVTGCFEEKRACSRLVEGRTWERWAEDHQRLFERLIRSGTTKAQRTQRGT